MKNLIIFGLFVVAMVLVQFAQAQTVDDVIDKYIAALGGKEKLLSLKTVKMEGSMNSQGHDFGVTVTRSHLVGSRLDIDIMGTNNYQVANMTKGSQFWPIRGMSEPATMDAEQYKSFVNQMDLQGSLLNYKEKGTMVELQGKETVDGAETNKLKVTYKNGLSTTFYIDAKTNRLVKTAGKMSVNGAESDVVTAYSDFKQNADGFWFPYSITTAQGTITYTKITTNAPVDENTYKN